MPKSKEQFEAMRNATREKILSAAINVFSRKGFAAASVQDIADEAGISIGLLYRHFKTKDEVFGAVLGLALVGYKEVVQQFEGDGSPKAVIGWFVDEILNDLANNAEFLQMILLLSQPFLSNMDFPWMEDLLQGNILMTNGLKKLIKKGQQLGEFKTGNAAQMAQHFFACIQGICISKQVLKEKYIPPTAEMMIGFLLK